MPSRPGRPKKRPPEAPPDRHALAAGFALSAEQRRADVLTKPVAALSNLSARLGSNRLNLIFFKKPCGTSGAINSRKTHLAVQHP